MVSRTARKLQKRTREIIDSAPDKIRLSQSMKFHAHSSKNQDELMDFCRHSLRQWMAENGGINAEWNVEPGRDGTALVTIAFDTTQENHKQYCKDNGLRE